MHHTEPSVYSKYIGNARGDKNNNTEKVGIFLPSFISSIYSIIITYSFQKKNYGGSASAVSIYSGKKSQVSSIISGLRIIKYTRPISRYNN
jgi:hypothetical protein